MQQRRKVNTNGFKNDIHENSLKYISANAVLLYTCINKVLNKIGGNLIRPIIEMLHFIYSPITYKAGMVQTLSQHSMGSKVMREVVGYWTWRLRERLSNPIRLVYRGLKIITNNFRYLYNKKETVETSKFRELWSPFSGSNCLGCNHYDLVHLPIILNCLIGEMGVLFIFQIFEI